MNPSRAELHQAVSSRALNAIMFGLFRSNCRRWRFRWSFQYYRRTQLRMETARHDAASTKDPRTPDRASSSRTSKPVLRFPHAWSSRALHLRSRSPHRFLNHHQSSKDHKALFEEPGRSRSGRHPSWRGDCAVEPLMRGVNYFRRSTTTISAGEGSANGAPLATAAELGNCRRPVAGHV